MSKLVLRLPDGSTREFTLGRERVTIGRRADNDVCLPFPAVSGEHAAVVTILDDSFLEDLKSTNGTLVNGTPITQHFLRDRDEIDLGRHTLIYLTGESAYPATGAFEEMLAPVTVTENGGATIGEDEATVVPPARSPVTGPQPVAESVDGTRPRLRAQPAPRAVTDASARNDAQAGAPLLEILNGPSAGMAVPVGRDEFVLGRPGDQIAALRQIAGGHRLLHVEGDRLPRLNGAPLPREGAVLTFGDEIEIAGTRLVWRRAV